jgi:ubiquinone/menaquinone biosynthesis C-methylase UbiE
MIEIRNALESGSQTMKTTHNKGLVDDDAVAAGAAIYSRQFLSVYDLYVLGFSNTFVWQCPSRLILDFYNAHISGKHIDVGVGTGYFLDKCKFPTRQPTIVLVDINPNSLHTSAKRLQRYHPTTHRANVFALFQLEEADFDTISLNYLLHCLPGNLLSKGAVLRNLKPLLNENGGVIFGTTILGAGIKQNFLAKVLMRAYNSKRIFSNLNDNAADLERVLQDNFRDYSIHIVGCVAFFVGRN